MITGAGAGATTATRGGAATVMRSSFGTTTLRFDLCSTVKRDGLVIEPGAWNTVVPVDPGPYSIVVEARRACQRPGSADGCAPDSSEGHFA